MEKRADTRSDFDNMVNCNVTHENNFYASRKESLASFSAMLVQLAARANS